MLTKHQELLVDVLKADGIDINECTANEWLQLAIEAENISRAMNPHDPFRPKFLQDQRQYMRAAELREAKDAA